MTRTSLTAMTAALLLTTTGCLSSNRVVGNELTEIGRWYGELGITGHLNRITVQSRSCLTKLSIIGDANKVEIEDGVTLAKIEVWGENNVVTVAPHLIVRVNQVGDGNRVVRRAPASGAPADQPLSGNTSEVYLPSEEFEFEPLVEPAIEPVGVEVDSFTDPDVVPE